VLIGTTAFANRVGAPTYEPPSGDMLKILDGNTLTGKYNVTTRIYSPLERTLIESGYIARLLAKYGIFDQYDSFLKTIYCESNFVHEGVFGSAGEYGLCQFKLKTFNYYCQGDWTDPYDQLECMASMWSRGLQSHWTCYK